MQIILQDKQLTLLPEKALWKEDEALLIIADIHLGKARHFRKAGIALSATSQHVDYENLRNLLKKTQPDKVYFLGDLFHSTFNHDWYLFEALIRNFPSVAFTLIKGNHDLINAELFKQLHIRVVNEFIEDDTFIYSHEPLEGMTHKINIAGHIHPGVSISGKARQSARMPCFYLKENTFLLPAFGALTGLYILPLTGEATIYAVVSGAIIQVTGKQEQ